MRRIIATAVVLGFVEMAQAATTYTYSGPNFDTFNNPAGVYSATNRVTGSFTVAVPLRPNLQAIDITPQLLSYSFSDGSQTLYSFNSRNCVPAPTGGFQVSTDSSGRITAWAIILCAPPITQAGEHFNNVYTTLGVLQTNEDGGQTDLVCVDLVMEVCATIGRGSAYSTGYRQGGDSPTSWIATTFTSVPALGGSGIALLAALLGWASLWALRDRGRER